ncbi:GAF domain-containing protein, partial [Proteus mirabilis]
MPQLNFYQELTDNLSALLSGENDFIASLANTSALIYEKLDKINWVG